MNGRCIGRTARMIQEAVSLASAGRRTLIVASTTRHANLIREMLPEGMEGVEVLTRSECDINWTDITVLGYPDFMILIDHCAIEHEFKAVFAMWRRFNYDNSL